MNTLLEGKGPSLEWRNPVASEPRFELWTGDEPLATLVFQPPDVGLAQVQTPEGRWTIHRAGFLGTSILLEEDSQQKLAVFHPGILGGGQLRFTNGVKFQWRHEGFGSGCWSFLGEGGEVLITLSLEREQEEAPSPHKLQAEVDITPAGRFSPRVPLLAALGWYLILLPRLEGEWSVGPVEQVF